MIVSMLEVLDQGHDLTMDQMSEVMIRVMQGDCPDDQLAHLLTALHQKGESVEEVAGAATVLRRQMTPIPTDRTDLLDTCGTGGDHSGTFNISTAAALVTASAGVPVAKHGNRGITSKSGSADVLAALGVNIEAGIDTIGRCLDQLGICFCFAPLLHPSMRHVAAVRKTLPFPTLFNLLGPLCNPASATRQLLGVGNSRLLDLLSEALVLLGASRALVVHGDDGLDEVTISTTTQVRSVTRKENRPLCLQPADFGIMPTALDALRVTGPEESARMIGSVLDGQSGPAREIVIANAATALWLADAGSTPLQCAQLAADAIDAGRARAVLSQLVEVSHS